MEKNLLSHESKDVLKATLGGFGSLARKVFFTEGYQQKYGHSEIWRYSRLNLLILAS